MPTLDRLAAAGCATTNFHTTALCSPTRAALLTGRNHHTCNMGAVKESPPRSPATRACARTSVAPLAEMLRLNGYSTAAFGKWHLTPLWETSVVRPVRPLADTLRVREVLRLPRRRDEPVGAAALRRHDQGRVPNDPNYHFMTDMTNQAIAWTRSSKSMTPDKPFFMYFAPGATHAPHHVPKEWIDKYKGKFDGGWDKYREETLARQIKLGVVPPGTKLAPKPEAIKDWDTLSRRREEAVRPADGGLRRLRRARRRRGRPAREGDRGHGRNGQHAVLLHRRRQRRERRGRHDRHVQRDDLLQRRPGDASPTSSSTSTSGAGRKSYPHFAAGWAVAGDTPFAWTKQVASDFGGTQNGMVVHWPKGIKAKGECARSGTT